MSFLKIALVLCVVIEQLDVTLAQTNECVGPPPPYNNSTFDRCVANQATGGCNCTDPAETCSFGDLLYFTCNHGTGLDFIIVCNYKDALGNFLGFIILQDSREKFEACTGSPAPVQSTPPPLPTFPPSNCSEFNVATWPPEGCIRLVGSQTTPNETTGILQVYFNTTWRTVCYTGIWTQLTIVDIACRMLGFNSHGSPAVQLAIHQLPPGVTNDAWTVNIEHTCSGTVTSLWDCDKTYSEPCWLTYAVGGSGECPSLLQISCEVNTTFPDLMSCQLPTTTIPNPTTSGPGISTHHTEERTAVPGHDASHTAGLSTGGIAGIVVAVVVAVTVLLIAGIWYKCYKATKPQEQTENPADGETDKQSGDNNPAKDEQEMSEFGEASNEAHSSQKIHGTSGGKANQTLTDRDSNQATQLVKEQSVNSEKEPTNVDSDSSTGDPTGGQDSTLPGETMPSCT